MDIKQILSQAITDAVTKAIADGKVNDGVLPEVL